MGLGRKSTGSFYTPDSFVRFLVQETLGPLCAERSPKEDPKPGELLKLKVLDPAMGSGHFQVEACRFLGEKLYEACRLCDEKALEAERKAEKAKTDAERQAALTEAAEYRRRVVDLPDPDDELVRYLPSRAPEGEESGLSQKRAEALCRRLVAVHCLYGVDKNPLAVELAKLALWIETQA
ncbi:MAG: N-6 DNA methylase, partial [Thermodesulfobacteriota bacterium]